MEQAANITILSQARLACDSRDDPSDSVSAPERSLLIAQTVPSAPASGHVLTPTKVCPSVGRTRWTSFVTRLSLRGSSCCSEAV